jgi:glycolate oxidase iron-sulfur subunit
MPDAVRAFDAHHPPDRAGVDTCVHCGFCLPTCPTYLLWNEEMDTPRGRLYLMKAGLDERVPMNETFVKHFDACLGCMACVTACPSGVPYSPLIEATRGQIERRYERPAGDRLFRNLLFAFIPYPGRMRLLMLPLVAWPPVSALLRSTGAIAALPSRLRALLELAPRVTLKGLFARQPERTPARGERRMTVGVLTGCVQRLAFSHVNTATINVLSAEGCDVVAPAGQGCCGALALHAGRRDEAIAFAKTTIETFEKAGVDRVVVNAAGCGSSMKEYGDLLSDDPAWAGRARRFASRVKDVTEALSDLGPARAPRMPMKMRVAYQDACHLAHAQGVRQPPRDLLLSIPGVTLVPLAEPEICCGSAGIYNLVQPDAARQLGDRKAAHIAAVEADVIASANPGCTLQIKAAAARRGATWRIVHPIELVDEAIRGVKGT